MKFSTVVRGLKSKIEFVWGKNPMPTYPILPHFLPPYNAFSMGRFYYHSKEARGHIVGINSPKDVPQGLIKA